MVMRLQWRARIWLPWRSWRCRCSSYPSFPSSSSIVRRHPLRTLSTTSACPTDLDHTRGVSAYNSTIQHLGRLGRCEDARRVFDGMPQTNVVSWNSMIAVYSHNGMMAEARSLFDALGDGRRNTRTWTAMVSGYARAGMVPEARRLFDAMPDRNVVSWNAMLTGYAQSGDVGSARALFDEMPERDAVSWNSMITGYCHAHMMGEARGLFDIMRQRDLVSWTVMMSGYVQVGDFAEAWNLFSRMQRSGVVWPDQSNFVAAISAAMGLRDRKLLESLRTWAIKTGFEGEVVVGTAILNAYTRSGRGLDSAVQFFDGMPQRNEFSWSIMISALCQFGRLDDAVSVFERDPVKSVASRSAMLTGYAQNGRIHEARLLFEQIPDPDVVLWNAMITGHAQNGMLDEAKELFDRMPMRNSVSWATIIAGFAQNGKSETALDLFLQLLKLEIFPSHSSLTSALFACCNIGALEWGRQIHSLSIKAGCQFNPYVGNGLITLYAKSNNSEDVTQAFKKMKVKDTVSWNSLIVGLSQNSMLTDARSAFEQMPSRDVVSWTAMISAYVQAGHGNEALGLFLKMLDEGITPNSSTLSSLISTCADLGSTILGRQIHSLTFKLGREHELFISNALITMYFKCGCDDSFRVFGEMPDRDVVTWNAVLSGCAQHGFGREAIELFKQMISDGVYPNQVTFLTLLCACSHAGLVDEGWEYFHSMSRDYGLTPLGGHYACVVDLLGRAGRLFEAESFIERMPFEPDSVVWSALLGACRVHQNAEIGRRVAERLFQLEPGNAGTYVLLSNIYASLGAWDEVREVRKLMRNRGVSKEPACSWMHIKNKLHFFVSSDTEHEHTSAIHATLKELYWKLKATGYVPDINCVLHDLEDEQKDNILLYHSEKLAVAYALLSTPKGTPIQIMKNLRICGDCHTFIKFVSKDSGRWIDVRDRNRFHHFRDGLCSCGEYW